MVDDAGEEVGYAWFTIEDRPVGRVVFIYDIAVDPAHRRKGHAQAALAEIEAYAREHGCIGVMLHVFGNNRRRAAAVPEGRLRGDQRDHAQARRLTRETRAARDPASPGSAARRQGDSSGNIRIPAGRIWLGRRSRSQPPKAVTRSVRAMATPSTITTPPRSCSTRTGSARNAAPRSTAMNGTRNWRAVIRVGPRRRIALKTTTFAIPAGMKAENARPAPRLGSHRAPVDAQRLDGARARQGRACRRPSPRPWSGMREWRRRIGAPKAV